MPKPTKRDFSKEREAQVIKNATDPLFKMMFGDDETPAGEPLKADWGDISPNDLGWLIASCAKKGWAVMFGNSRDGTQYYLRIYAGDASKPKWFSGNYEGQEQLALFIRELCTRLDSLE